MYVKGLVRFPKLFHITYCHPPLQQIQNNWQLRLWHLGFPKYQTQKQNWNWKITYTKDSSLLTNTLQMKALFPATTLWCHYAEPLLFGPPHSQDLAGQYCLPRCLRRCSYSHRGYSSTLAAQPMMPLFFSLNFKTRNINLWFWKHVVMWSCCPCGHLFTVAIQASLLLVT